MHRLSSLGLGLVTVVAVGCPAGRGSWPAVRPGIQVLLDDSVHLMAGRRVGLLTNQTGVDAAGVSDLDRLIASDAQVTAIFTPEHGYRGVLNLSDIGHGIDSATGIPVFSLYGEVREPTPAMLETIDVLLVDLQDIGARPYTYISTTLLAMRACVGVGVPVVVLDRPNPIGGGLVQGPLLDSTHASFVGMLPVPMRHGLTLGELARLGNEWLGIGTDLTVVPADGWHRSRWFDETGLPWVRPSPSMPDLESATHYPGTVLFEATNLSVGRGTPVAFQVVGAPWLDAARVVARLGPQAGVSVTDIVVAPEAPPDGKYGGQTIPAVRLRVGDRQRYHPVSVAVGLLAAIRAEHPESLVVNERRLAQLIGTAAVWEGVLAGQAPAQLVASWGPDILRFHRDRDRFLLYP